MINIIKKYFYNIDKNILYKIMNSFVSEKKYFG